MQGEYLVARQQLMAVNRNPQVKEMVKEVFGSGAFVAKQTQERIEIGCMDKMAISPPT